MFFYGISSDQSTEMGCRCKWSFVNFGDSGTDRLAYSLMQVPQLSITRYLWRGFSLEGGVTLSFIDELEAFTEIPLTTCLLTMVSDMILTYLNRTCTLFYLGGSIINGPSTIPGSKATPTFNIGLGGTHYSPLGIKCSRGYKYSQPDYSMRSHSSVCRYSL